MRTTLILDVDDDLADFMEQQGATIDPSAFINKLVREEKKREHARQCALHADEAGQKGASYMDDRITTLEKHLDEDTHAGD